MKSILFLSMSVMAVVDSLRFAKHPDQGLTIDQIIRKHGYPVEIHRVITEDGYITQAYRIPRGKRSTKPSGEPILFLHGQCGCSENWIVAGPNSSSAYYLADRGYDVWLMNNKGNRHGRAHKTMHPDKDPEFWNFGWHEVGIYDIPAFIDYILLVTNRKKVFFIGHSSGATSYFAFAADRPEYNDKIELAILSGPSAVLKGIQRSLSVLTDIMTPLKLAGVLELFPLDINKVINNVLGVFCAEVTIMSKICAQIFYFGTTQTEQMDQITPQHIFQTSPAGCAIRGLIHYGQLLKKEDFFKYDYGMEGNMKVYKSRKPPLYNLTNAKAPIALIYSSGDNLVGTKGLSILVKRLPNVASSYEVPVEEFGHIDFIFGKNIHHWVSEPIFKMLKKYSK